MTSFRIEGEATVLASISHGGDHAGTTQYLRREKICGPNGVVEVPVISGNGVRGMLRDISADVCWELLGKPELPLPVFDALWSGGSLVKTGSNSALTAQQLSELRRLCPHVALFGCAGGGRIIEGCLRVGKMLPVCAETSHLLPAGIEPVPTSVWEMLQLEAFSRQDDAKRGWSQNVLPPVVSGELTTGDEPAGPGGTDGVIAERDSAQQMRYEVETIAAGTKLWWWFSLDEPTDLAVGQLRAALNRWSDSGAHIGGRSSTGHGRLRMELTGWLSSSPSTTTGTELAESWQAALTQHHQTQKDRIVEALGWLR